ncbi:MAG: uracil-DNA glycosylase [Balneolaceae bacterium]
MSESNPNELLERASRLLKQQREVYGDFSVEFDAASPGKTSVQEAEPALDNKIDPVKAEEPTQTHSPEPLPSMPSEAELIANCATLEELKTLCEKADVLKTDLLNTNLVFGVGNTSADLMIVGEAPGANEDRQGEPFVGRAGKLLDQIMEAIDFKRSDIYIANILKHRPPDNRDPKPEERRRSLPYLLRQIELVNPKLVLCVGRISATTLLGKDYALKDMRQKFHEFHGRELFATYHPAALLRNPNWKRPTWEDVQMLRARYDELGGQP